MNLSSQAEAFVVHFGEMGSRWGFNRTVGQMLALIVIHEQALNADQISSLLNISRGNVSMGLKELQSWRLVSSAKQSGDRKEYFTAAGSIWDLARTVFEERSRREMAPTLSLLRSQLMDSKESEQDAHAMEKMAELYEMLEMLNEWCNSVNALSQKQLESLIKMGRGVTKVLEFKSKVL